MNILSANEIKKHGVGAIEKQLAYGPVHVFKHNHPLFIVISEKDYKLLSQKNKTSGLFSMLDKSATGKRTKQDIEQQLNTIRNDWE